MAVGNVRWLTTRHDCTTCKALAGGGGCECIIEKSSRWRAVTCGHGALSSQSVWVVSREMGARNEHPAGCLHDAGQAWSTDIAIVR